jgi:hypothetical protein
VIAVALNSEVHTFGVADLVLVGVLSRKAKMLSSSQLSGDSVVTPVWSCLPVTECNTEK